MSKKHNKSRRHSTSDGSGHQKGGKGLHRDWRAWVVVLLMLTGILMYVFSLDESLVPGEAPQEEVAAPLDDQ